METRTTIPYECYKNYRNNFYSSSNLEKVLKECRDFVSGKQYTDSLIDGMPKPIFNITREYAVKSSAKITEIKPYITFIADVESENLTKLDQFYEFQRNEIDDDDFIDKVAYRGFIDGTCIALTSYDNDTLGSNSDFRGFIKRNIILAEDIFLENPYLEDIQDQSYFGYVLQMQVKAVKQLDEFGRSEKELDDLLVGDEFSKNHDRNDIDNKSIPVYTRFFRKNGEVYFEVATKYCDLFKTPHALNPRLNDKIALAMKKKYEKSLEDGVAPTNCNVIDYDIDVTKYVLFTKAEKSNFREHAKEKSKFYRYPFSVYRPYPKENSFFGESGVSMIIANQKIINYTFLLITLIMQSHAMPKYLAKQGSLKGQVIDGSPNQIIYDYSPITSGASWGITRLGAGDAINSNLIDVGSSILKLTRNVNGFDDLTSQITSDTSGYLYQQMVQQSNLMLIGPQKKLFKFIKDQARTDLLFFKHFVPKASYYTELSDSEYELQENYRKMSQNLVSNNVVEGVSSDTLLPKVKKLRVVSIDNSLFDSDFNVSVSVETGIASSRTSETQHYQQVFQYIANGNLDADKIKIMVQNDPGFSSKLRSKVMASIEALEVSQLQLKNQEIDQLKQTINQLMATLQKSSQSIEILKKYDTAKNKALQENIDQNRKVVEAYASNTQNLTESQVKANNAKGISGTSFSKNDNKTFNNQ